MSELQHPDSRPFELVADVYERARPEYPRDAVAWLAGELDLREGRTVLDLGAGTGKLTRRLVETGARVIAVEPGDAMRAELVRAVPDAEALRGSAEEIPLPDDSVDAITVGQAFHWFRHDEALPAIHRVLRRRGGIALIWNSRDQEAALQLEVNELLESLVPPERAAAGNWSRALVESDLFGPVEERRFRFSQELDADALADRIASVSFVAAAPPEARAHIDSRIRAIVEEQGGGRVEFPYVTDVYVSRAV